MDGAAAFLFNNFPLWTENPLFYGYKAQLWSEWGFGNHALNRQENIPIRNEWKPCVQKVVYVILQTWLKRTFDYSNKELKCNTGGTEQSVVWRKNSSSFHYVDWLMTCGYPDTESIYCSFSVYRLQMACIWGFKKIVYQAEWEKKNPQNQQWILEFEVKCEYNILYVKIPSWTFFYNSIKTKSCDLLICLVALVWTTWV